MANGDPGRTCMPSSEGVRRPTLVATLAESSKMRIPPGERFLSLGGSDPIGQSQQIAVHVFADEEELKPA